MTERRTSGLGAMAAAVGRRPREALAASRGDHAGIRVLLESLRRPQVALGWPVNLSLVADRDLGREVLGQSDDRFSVARASSSLWPYLGEASMGRRDGDESRAVRAAAAPALRPDAWTAAVAPAVAAEVASWQPGAPVDLRASMNRICWRTCGRAAFGAEVDVDPLLDAFTRLQPDVESQRWLSGRGVPRRTTARVRSRRDDLERAMDDLFDSPDGRAATSHGPLASLAASFDVATVRDTAISFFTVGATTLAGGLAWALVECAADRDLWSRCANDGATWLPAVVSEVLRVHNPVTLIARVVIADTTLEGVVFPEGQRIVVCPPHAGFDAGGELDVFRPARWLDGTAIATEPFGSGPRRCPGGAMSRQVMAELIGCLAGEVELDVAPPPWRSRGFVSNFPIVDCTVSSKSGSRTTGA